MAGMADPGYNADMQQVAIPDYDSPGAQPLSNLDWAAPIPGDPSVLVDSLIGDPTGPGQPFVRVVSTNGETDVPDGTA